MKREREREGKRETLWGLESSLLAEAKP